MKKKILKITAVFFAVILAMSSVMLSFPVSALTEDSANDAAEGSSGITGSCTWSLDKDGVLTISGNGDMADYTTLKGQPWGNEIKEVVIEDGVLSVGTGAFASCTKLETSVIADSVKKSTTVLSITVLLLQI